MRRRTLPGTATADRPRRWGASEIMRRPLLLTLVLALGAAPAVVPATARRAARAVRDLRGPARPRLRAREARAGLLDARVARRPLAARSSCTGTTSPRRPPAGRARLRRDRSRGLPLGRLRRRHRRRARARLGGPADALRPGAALGHPGRARHVTRPRPQEFRAFVTAAARHYAGQVRTLSIWNEPNQPQFLRPAVRPPPPAGLAGALPRPALRGLRGLPRRRACASRAS